MKKTLLSALIAVALAGVQPIRGQEAREPKQVSATDALLQLDDLFIQDMTIPIGAKRIPAEETLRIAKSIIKLNEIQIELYEDQKAITEKPDAWMSAAMENLKSSFRGVRNDVCTDRPHIRVIDLDGHVKPCRND